jgi:hypothetical protein
MIEYTKEIDEEDMEFAQDTFSEALNNLGSSEHDEDPYWQEEVSLQLFKES